MNYERKYSTTKRRLESALKSIDLLQHKNDELQHENTLLKADLKEREEKIDSLILMVDEIKKEQEKYYLEKIRYKEEFEKLLSSLYALKKNYAKEMNAFLKGLRKK